MKKIQAEKPFRSLWKTLLQYSNKIDLVYFDTEVIQLRSDQDQYLASVF